MVTDRLRRLGSTGRVLVAVGVGAAVFGIATAVQASIPDGNQIVHSCYNASLAHGSPIGAMRAIDTAKAGGVCAAWEGAVDLATPQYVQNVVASTLNQTTIMGRATIPALVGPNRAIQWTCGGWVATNPTVSIDPPTFSGASGAPLTVHAMTNVEMQNSGFPGTTEWIWIGLASTQDVHTQITCVDPRVYGETEPVAARAQPTVTVK